MTAIAEATATTILRGALGSDGKMRLTLAKREAAKLLAAHALCVRLLAVPSLADKAKAAGDAIAELSQDVCDGD